MQYISEYRDSRLCRKIIEEIAANSQQNIRLMEVCGTHTVSIFRNGIRSVLPDTISLLSGPGCPVCVTAQGEIDAAIGLAREKDTIVTTFGDLIRVPGTASSLQKEKAAGRDIRIVYSAADAVDIARQTPDKTVVFLGVGFETTAPTIAASVLTARQAGIENFTVFAMHKTVPHALEALMDVEAVKIDGFILPGHVSVIIGTDGYNDFFDKYRVPCAVAGFEPVDMLRAIADLSQMLCENTPRLKNCYPRAVTARGNPGAKQIMDTVFETCDANWRGLGRIADSGLKFRKKFSAFDAMEKFNISVEDAAPPTGCACGDILTGKKTPPECRLYKSACTPMEPVGPCMVSTEGTCAAYFKYER